LKRPVVIFQLPAFLGIIFTYLKFHLHQFAISICRIHGIVNWWRKNIAFVVFTSWILVIQIVKSLSWNFEFVNSECLKREFKKSNCKCKCTNEIIGKYEWPTHRSSWYRWDNKCICLRKINDKSRIFFYFICSIYHLIFFKHSWHYNINLYIFFRCTKSILPYLDKFTYIPINNFWKVETPRNH
jgi:hypothetical protein